MRVHVRVWLNVKKCGTFPYSSHEEWHQVAKWSSRSREEVSRSKYMVIGNVPGASSKKFGYEAF